MYIMLDDMYVTMSISTGLYPNFDLWTANKLQLQLQHISNLEPKIISSMIMTSTKWGRGDHCEI